MQGYHKLCSQCPCRTPLKADPDSIRMARELQFEPPLDEGIREIVEILIASGVETFESCQGGEGHSSPEPVVRFEGSASEGLRALSVAVAYGMPVSTLRRAWGVIDGTLYGPWWEMTFVPPRIEECLRNPAPPTTSARQGAELLRSLSSRNR